MQKIIGFFRQTASKKLDTHHPPPQLPIEIDEQQPPLPQEEDTRPMPRLEGRQLWELQKAIDMSG